MLVCSRSAAALICVWQLQLDAGSSSSSVECTIVQYLALPSVGVLSLSCQVAPVCCLAPSDKHLLFLPPAMCIHIEIQQHPVVMGRTLCAALLACTQLYVEVPGCAVLCCALQLSPVLGWGEPLVS